jgi:hypothetical protein
VTTGVGFLWDSQWADLDAVLVRHGLKPSDFKRTAVVSRKTLFGLKPLPPHQQSGSLGHSAFDDIWLTMSYGGEEIDGEADEPERTWIVEISPTRDRLPRSTRSQTFGADDFDDDVLDLADAWAAVVAKELAARAPVERARQKAESDWSGFRQSPSASRPLELTEVSGFLHNELRDLVADGLRGAGIWNETVVQSGVDAVLANTADVEEQIRRTPVDKLEDVFRTWLLPRVKARLEGEAFNVAMDVVMTGVRLFIRELLRGT